MKTITGLLLGALLLAALAATWIAWNHRGSQERLDRAALRHERDRNDRLQQERDRLAASSEATGAGASTVDPTEIDRLKSDAESLKRSVNTAREASAASTAKTASRAPEPPKTPEYYASLHQRAGARSRDAMSLIQAVFEYSREHGGRVPTAVDELGTYVQRGGNPLSGTNQYELVYEGSMEALSKAPGGAIAILRDRGVWTAPSGKKARVYGMVNGSAQIVESDDDFRSWEAEHLVKPKTAPTPVR